MCARCFSVQFKASDYEIREHHEAYIWNTMYSSRNRRSTENSSGLQYFVIIIDRMSNWHRRRNFNQYMHYKGTASLHGASSHSWYTSLDQGEY